MTAITFIGLGVMGSPMALNLHAAGYEVRAHTRTATKAEPLRAAGGTICGSVAEAVAGTSIVCLCLPDTPDVEEVLRGEDGVLRSAEPGALVIDFSTIRPDATRELAQEARERGLRMIDAPVSGGQAGAEAGTLSVMVGGESSDVAAAREVLEAVGRTVVHVGPSGAGQAVKAANQLVVAGNIQVLAEAVVMLRQQGLDLGPALDALAGGLAGSAVLTQKRANLVEHRFEPGFRIDLHDKDLRIVTDTLRESDTTAPVASLLATLVSQAVADGDGGLDHSALLRGVERLNSLDESPDADR